MTAPVDRLTTFFADLDKVLAVLARPDFQIDELKLRLAHNKRCKDQLVRGRNVNANAFDLTAIEAGLVARLVDAEKRLQGADADTALTSANVDRGQRLLVITADLDREAA
ncbi:hypothetical protein [Methylobacterium brachythecii]|uniref:Uncharacterized protein n=1 Tax=Methylobacterium brachythecii TaxID=1176177 RepID=A0A7W6API9_9HYPH|nr:hypothetical protein [Methylobacterium brachythecii]MBB3905084.1 hypothetical protein [Methylobacterium brachythecii]GLS44408.1 hypothetical protein GCM10007884_23960 [Methylobacterium brachythecii]